MDRAPPWKWADLRAAIYVILLGAALAGILAQITGYATITAPMDWERAPPADWPVLKVTVISVDAATLRAACPGAVMPAGAQLIDCVSVDFDKRTCTVGVLPGWPEGEKHGRGHCFGYDHPGSSKMSDGWEKWKRGQR